MDNIFIQVADVLEKTAEYLENEELSKEAQEEAERKKEANSLAQKVSEVTGQVITDDLVEKLSEASPDVKELIGNIASTDVVDSLGGPVQTVVGIGKEASAPAETGSAEQALLDFLQS